MPRNVIITPASGLIDFKDDAGNIDAFIQLDGSGNLNISNSGGNLSLGNTATDVYIGDGVNSVDIIFEQNGDIRALAGKTLTLGQSDSNITVASPTVFNSTVTATNPTINSGAKFNGSTSGTTTVIASAVAGTTTLTLPAATDTLVGRATTDTLTNKTLTTPTINGGFIAGTFVGAITLSDTTASTSTTTGALKLSGGLGVAGALNAALVRVNNSYTLPTNDGASANVMITNGAGQLQFVDVNTIVAQTLNLSTNQDFGLLAENFTQSVDLGLVTEGFATSYDWGVIANGGIIYPDQLVLPKYTVAQLPSSQIDGQLIFISNESGGAVPAFSDGTNWRRVTDRVIVS